MNPEDSGEMTSEAFDALCTAVGRLPPQRRPVLMLHAVYGYSCPEIARYLGTSVRIVRRDLAAALQAAQGARAAIEDEEAGLYERMMALRRGEGAATGARH